QQCVANEVAGRQNPRQRLAQEGVGVEYRQDAGFVQPCQLALTMSLDVGGHGRVTLLEMLLADARQGPTMPLMNTRLAIAAAALLTLGACAKQPQESREIDWAKAALARNPQLEVVATDEAAGTFTVREISSGTLRQLRVNELVA